MNSKLTMDKRKVWIKKLCNKINSIKQDLVEKFSQLKDMDITETPPENVISFYICLYLLFLCIYYFYYNFVLWKEKDVKEVF